MNIRILEPVSSDLGGHRIKPSVELSPLSVGNEHHISGRIASGRINHLSMINAGFQRAANVVLAGVTAKGRSFLTSRLVSQSRSEDTAQSALFLAS